MDPKALLLLPGLVAPQHHGASRAMTHSLTAPATPVYEWPEREREPLEGDHPGHGEGSDESWMFVGINSNVSNTARVTVDSGALGVSPYTAGGWLQKGLNLVASFGELEAGESTPEPLPYATNLSVSPNGSKHLNNPSTIRTRRSFTRRG
jgi:hypothetical protein